MKMQVLSDTHGFEYEISEEADVIVHAGDFSDSLKGVHDYAERCTEMGKDFVFTLGNHDYFDSDVTNTVSYLKERFPSNFIAPGGVLDVQGYKFVGGTLFTNFRANRLLHSQPTQWDLNKQTAREWIYDFQRIFHKRKVVHPNDYVTFFEETYNHIKKFKEQENVVVVTHFPPHLACLDPYWGTHPTASALNPYFINDLDVKGFKTWISGHTHTAIDTVVDGCRLVINPYGYPDEHDTNGFRAKLIVEV